jgi:hypothetical protein
MKHSATFFLQLSVKPKYLNQSETWWLRNRDVDTHAINFWHDRQVDVNRLFDAHFDLKKALGLLDDLHKQAALDVATSRAIRHSQTPSSSSFTGNGSGTGHAGVSVALSRIVVHPLFANVDAAGAEQRLRSNGSGAGAVLFRPSSGGWDQLTLTWAFQEGVFRHVHILEKDKRPGETSIGNSLYVLDDDMEQECFHDLDEIYATLIERFNLLVHRMQQYNKFKAGGLLEVESFLQDQVRANPNVIPYCVCFEPGKPYFAWTWLQLRPDGVHVVKRMPIHVHFKVSSLSLPLVLASLFVLGGSLSLFVRSIDFIVQGYKVTKGEVSYFETPLEIANWFKKHYSQSAGRLQNQRAAIAAMNSTGEYFAAPSRKTRFDRAPVAPTTTIVQQQQLSQQSQPLSQQSFSGDGSRYDSAGAQRGSMYIPPPPPPRRR